MSRPGGRWLRAQLARREARDWTLCAQCGCRLAPGPERWVVRHYRQPEGYPEWVPGDDRDYCSWACLQQALGTPRDA
ncbi:MAG TPA: hypothetical protein VE953_22460 [Terriglobales bacterium]|nr:hypothetical protein [Terriglobales bacterium]